VSPNNQSLACSAVAPLRFELPQPDLSHWRAGNTGVEGVWRFEADAPGRELLVTALVHGNELCGAWALVQALQAGLRPRRGALTLAFVNLAAFDRFDADDAHASRFVDHDLNRLWGAMPWRDQTQPLSIEQRRVLELLPFVERSQWLLDLHSMHEPGPPLGLVGPLPHHAQHALRLGAPALLVSDAGHRAGCRLRDHGAYGDAATGDHFSLLVECGWHGALSSKAVARDMLARFVVSSGSVDAGDVPAAWFDFDVGARRQRIVQVTDTVTVADGPQPTFAQPWACGDVVEGAGTLLGHNGGEPFHTPYARCVLIMPTLVHATPGATLMRLGRQAT
jgi:Succinylglutamate desuccinylase / Aspartoacylase family